MKTKEKDTEQTVKMTESDLLSLVSNRLRDRVLFQEKIEEAKQFIKNIKSSVL